MSVLATVHLRSQREHTYRQKVFRPKDRQNVRGAYDQTLRSSMNLNLQDLTVAHPLSAVDNAWTVHLRTLTPQKVMVRIAP